MAYTPLIFDPTQVDLFQKNPTNARHIRAHIESGDAKTGKHQKRDFRAFATQDDITRIRKTSMSSQTIFDLACRLMVRAIVAIEGYSESEAQQVISILIPKASSLERIVKLSRGETDEVELVMVAASELYDIIDTELYVQSMKLNLEDFQTFFPVKSCLHNPQLVLKRLENQSYVVTKEERMKHLRDNRAMSFSIVGCMSMYDVRENTIDPDMRLLINAGRYQTMKALYDDAADAEEPEPRVRLKDELDGAVID